MSQWPRTESAGPPRIEARVREELERAAEIGRRPWFSVAEMLDVVPTFDLTNRDSASVVRGILEKLVREGFADRALGLGRSRREVRTYRRMEDR